MRPKTRFATPIPWILLTILTAGCDEEQVRLAREAADRQARQNEVMAELHGEVAAAARQLVEADAKARREIVSVHGDLMAERTRLDAGREALDEERRSIARVRRSESLLVAAFPTIGAVLVVALLLGFSWYALVAVRGGDESSQLAELLVDELLDDSPRLPPAGSRQLPSPNERLAIDRQPDA